MQALSLNIEPTQDSSVIAGHISDENINKELLVYARRQFIIKSDAQRLNPNRMLNDNIINFYIMYLLFAHSFNYINFQFIVS